MCKDNYNTSSLKSKYWSKELEEKCRKSCREFIFNNLQVDFDGYDKNDLTTIDDILFHVCWRVHIVDYVIDNPTNDVQLLNDVEYIWTEEIENLISSFLSNPK